MVETRIGSTPEAPEHDSVPEKDVFKQASGDQNISFEEEQQIVEVVEPEVIPTTPERLRSRFMNEINSNELEVSIPSSLYNDYERVIFESFLDPLFYRFSESITEEVHLRVAEQAIENPDDYFDIGDTAYYEIIALFEGDRNSAAGNRDTSETPLCMEAASFVARTINHIVEGETLAETRQMNAHDLAKLQSILIVSIPSFLGETDDTYLDVMDLIISSQSFEPVAPVAEGAEVESSGNENIETVLSYLVGYNTDMQSVYDAGLESAQSRGLNPVEITSKAMRAGAILHTMTQLQQEQLITYALDPANYSAEYDEIIVTLAIRSQSGMNPRRVKSLILNSGLDSAIKTSLISQIDSQAEEAREQMQQAVDNIITNLDQQSLTNPISNVSTAMAVVGLMYAGVVGITNALLFLTSKDPSALGYAAVAFGAGTVAYDTLAGRGTFSTIADLGSQLIFRREDIRNFHESILVEALNRIVFWNMPDEPIAALGNRNVIRELKLTCDLSETEGFSREIFLNNLQGRIDNTSDPAERENLQAAWDVLYVHFGSMSQDKADSDLFMLGHVFGQMDIDDYDELDREILEPSGISIPGTVEGQEIINTYT